MIHLTALQTSKLVPNKRRPAPPSQARVDAMAESIRSLGMILEPLKVRSVRGSYEIVDGEARWLAAQQLNIDIVPIQVIELEDDTSPAASLLLNMDRESIAPEDVISNLERLVDAFGVDAAASVLESLPVLREAASASPELQDRLDALLTNCRLDLQE